MSGQGGGGEGRASAAALRPQPVAAGRASFQDEVVASRVCCRPLKLAIRFFLAMGQKRCGIASSLGRRCSTSAAVRCFPL